MPTLLRVPPLQRIMTSHTVASIEERISLISGGTQNFISTFGLELRAATLMAAGADAASRHILQRMLSRPAAEAVLLHAWPKLSQPEMDLASMQALASGLAAKPLMIAKGRMRTQAGHNGDFTVYAPPEQRNNLPVHLAEARAAAADHPLASALVAYSLTILSHPLNDGNGRLARAILHGTLAQGGLVKAPVLPLAPAFYAQAETVRMVMKELSSTGDWMAAVESLSPIILLACELAFMTDLLTAADARRASVEA